MGGKKYIVLGLIALFVFLRFIPHFINSGTVDNMASCVFCDIVNGKMPQTKIEVETEEFVIFKDIKPASTHHYLAVSKRHIDSVKTLTKEDDGLVTNMEAGLRDFYTSRGIDTNDTLFGCHLPPFISVKHLHMHAIAPRSTMGFMHRMMFKPGSSWFKTPDEVHRIIKQKS